MRTTLTLDDDVAAALERLRRKRDASLRDLVNEALREGLKQMTGRPAPREPLQTRAVLLGECRIGNVDNVADALAVAEGEGFPVILVDANLLVYAHVAGFSQHERARAWLDEQLNGRARVGLPWPSLLAFLRLVTNARIFARPESAADAWRQVTEWLEQENAWIPEPTERHREILGTLLTGGNVTGNLVPDAHLAALAIEHGLTLCSTDGDFGRFAELRWENPLR